MLDRIPPFGRVVSVTSGSSGLECPIAVREVRYEYGHECGLVDCHYREPGSSEVSDQRPSVQRQVVRIVVVANTKLSNRSQRGVDVLTSSTDRIVQVARHCTRDGSLCFRSTTGEVVQLEKLEFWFCQ